jgi:assimilatory nitrate reductase catalytic subunit
MSRSGTLGRLFGQAAEPAIELHPQDLARRGFKAGELLRVQSRRGEMVLPVQPSDSVAPAQAFIAMHWGEEFVSGRARDGSVLTGVNALTPSTFCPTSKQPELKHAAIRLEAAALPWQLLAAAWLPAELMLQRREAVMALLQGCGYFSALPCGHEPDGRVGLVLRAADTTQMAAERLHALEALLGLHGSEVLRYADVQRGQHRAMHLAEGGSQASLQAFMLAGDIRARDWVLPLWRDAQPARSLGTRLLAASPQPPAAFQPRGAQVCSCFDVGEAQIRRTLATLQGSAESRLAQLQQRLHCGTNCGSCKPALQVLVGQCLEAA